MNRVILIGRITKEIELKRTPSDLPYTQFTIAVNRNYQNKQGERQSDFISCVAWRTTAELLAKYVKKGNQIGIEGQIQTRTYDDSNGARHYVTEVLCENIQFLEPRKQDDFGQTGYQNPFGDVPTQPRYQQSYNQYNRNDAKPQQKQENPFDDISTQFDISSDDLPF